MFSPSFTGIINIGYNLLSLDYSFTYLKGCKYTNEFDSANLVFNLFLDSILDDEKKICTNTKIRIEGPYTLSYLLQFLQ